MEKFIEIKHHILYLYPTFTKEINTCPFSTKACRSSCLVNCGLGQLKPVINSRKRKTYALFEDFDEGINQIINEITALSILENKNKKLVFRINGTSDIDFSEVWTNESLRNLCITFCEYTKNPILMTKFLNGYFPSNVHFTFSYSGKNWKLCEEFLRMGGNVAVPFATKKLPKTYKGFKVISGDEHDLRFLDNGKGVIVGLTAKGSKEKIKVGIREKFFIEC